MSLYMTQQARVAVRPWRSETACKQRQTRPECADFCTHCPQRTMACLAFLRSASRQHACSVLCYPDKMMRLSAKCLMHLLFGLASTQLVHCSFGKQCTVG